MGQGNMEKLSFFSTLKAWIQLSRVPFHSVGVLPFILGTVLAWKTTGIFHLPVFLLGVIAVILIMLCTYYTGEYCDIFEDKLSADMERNTFSGGSQVIVKNLLPDKYPMIASYIALALTVMVGLIIKFYYKTGVLTIPLGIIGMISGFFYSKMPIRWVAKGIGELLIGFCYGWLPVAVSFYLQTGRIDPIIHWIALPIACTIFNVILVNEFPDHPADVIARKSNLVVRLGKEKASYLYISVTLAAWITFMLSTAQGLSNMTFVYYAPVFAVSAFLVIAMFKKGYLNKKMLEVICGLTIVTNLGTSLAYTLAILHRGL
jgi:1,4-dihydroxy-2-naphthoate polyprenyltransferase